MMHSVRPALAEEPHSLAQDHGVDDHDERELATRSLFAVSALHVACAGPRCRSGLRRPPRSRPSTRPARAAPLPRASTPTAYAAVASSAAAPSSFPSRDWPEM